MTYIHHYSVTQSIFTVLKFLSVFPGGFQGSHLEGLPWWLRRYESNCSEGKPGFNPCVGNIPWRRKWQPTPISLPGRFHGQGSLAGYSPWSSKESDIMEWPHFHFSKFLSALSNHLLHLIHLWQLLMHVLPP